MLLHIPIITSALLPVTLIDPLGHSVVDLVPVVLGQITLPLTGPVPGVYTAKYSIGGKDYVTQRDVMVPEPAMSWVFEPGVLPLLSARRRVLRRTSFGFMLRAGRRSMSRSVDRAAIRAMVEDCWRSLSCCCQTKSSGRARNHHTL